MGYTIVHRDRHLFAPFLGPYFIMAAATVAFLLIMSYQTTEAMASNLMSSPDLGLTQSGKGGRRHHD